MGGPADNHEVQQIAVQYPYNQPQQQNVYFQPPQPQFVPQNYAYVPEQPVLQASSMYPQAVPVYPQVPLPQPAYPVIQPTEAAVEQQAEAPRSCRWRCCGTRAKQFFASLDAYRVCSSLTVLSAISYFLFTPHAWPWFLMVAALSIGYCGTKYIKETRMLNEKEPRFYVHALWYGSINTAFVLINLWSGAYPWSVFPLCIWGAAVAFHALKVYNNNVFKTRLYSHFIIYMAVMTMVLVAATRGRRASPLGPLIVLAVWSLIVTLHARKVKRDEERRQQSEQQPEGELQVISSAVPQQNETDVHLVQQQQEVFNSIQQAQQQQRALNANQPHLFQQQ